MDVSAHVGPVTLAVMGHLRTGIPQAWKARLPRRRRGRRIQDAAGIDGSACAEDCRGSTEQLRASADPIVRYSQQSKNLGILPRRRYPRSPLYRTRRPHANFRRRMHQSEAYQHAFVANATTGSRVGEAWFVSRLAAVSFWVGLWDSHDWRRIPPVCRGCSSFLSKPGGSARVPLTYADVRHLRAQRPR